MSGTSFGEMNRSFRTFWEMSLDMVQKKSTVQNGDAISKLISTKSEEFFEKFPKTHDATQVDTMILGLQLCPFAQPAAQRNGLKALGLPVSDLGLRVIN